MGKVLSKQKVNKLNNSILHSIVIFVLMCICNVASIDMGYIYPCGFALYFAMLFNSKQWIMISILYILSYSVIFFNLNSIYTSACVVCVALGFYAIHRICNKRPHTLLVMLYAIIANAGYFYFFATSAERLVECVITLVVGELILFSMISFYNLKGRNLNIKLTADNALVIGIQLSVLAMGLSEIAPLGIEIAKVLGVLFVLIICYCADIRYGLIVGFFCGLGMSFHFTNISYVGAFVGFAMMSYCFKGGYKTLMCVAVILLDVVVGVYFGAYHTYSLYSLLSVMVGALIFLCLPNSVMQKIKNKLGFDLQGIAVRGIINRSRQLLKNRVKEIGNVFVEMDSVYRQMVKGAISIEQSKELLKNDLVEKCCVQCENRHKCLKINGEYSTEIFKDIASSGFSKAKITLLDLPQYFTTKCTKINNVVNTTNALLLSYKNYAVMVNNMDSSKLLIAEQLKGVSGLMMSLANEMDLSVGYDLQTEDKIKEELGYKNICCLDVLVYEQSNHVKFVSLLLSQSFEDVSKLEKIISKILKINVYLFSQDQSGSNGSVELLFKTRANYDVVFGSSAVTKSGKLISGDTHSFIKIDDGKYMIALCDGMGSGEKAFKISDLTLTLIENFYKAGFDNNIILQSVNKLLSLNSDELFSALDICVVDLRKGSMDFIKLGSPHGFIKHKNSTDIIQSSGLPIGVLEEMKPHITRRDFTDFDILVFVTDGVSDAFGDVEELSLFINNSQQINPQSLADEILDRAVDLVDGVCTDDFTVLAVRIYPLV